MRCCQVIHDPHANHSTRQVTLATDYFGPVLLTHLLLPALARAAPSRIIDMSRGGEMMGRVDWGDLR